jgi:type I restriction enzyme S subunit
VEDNPENLIVSTGFATLTPETATLPKFLWRVVQSDCFVDAVVAYSQGVGYPAITPSNLASLPVWLPPLSEQRRIAAFLDRETARLDALIARKERLLALLAEKRTALISHAVTKGLDPSVLMRDSGIAWLGEIPAHWEVSTVGRHFGVELGKMLNRSSEDGTGMVKPYVRAANVHWNGVDLNNAGVNEMEFSSAQLERYRLRPGDLLVTEGGVTVGRSVVWSGELEECYYQNSLNRARVLPGSPLSTKYLYYWMYFTTTNGYVDLAADKATFQHLTNKMLSAFPFVVPDGSEQRAIAVFLDGQTAKLDALSAKVRAAIEKLREYRAALIAAAVTGKIDVREAAIHE